MAGRNEDTTGGELLERSSPPGPTTQELYCNKGIKLSKSESILHLIDYLPFFSDAFGAACIPRSRPAVI